MAYEIKPREHYKNASSYGAALWQARNPERARAYKAEWRAKNRERIRAHNAKKKAEDPLHRQLITAKHRAKRRGLPFGIRSEDLSVPEFCPVLGLRLETATGGNPKLNSPSLDRIVPELGYVVGNVQVISHQANTMKSGASKEELLRFAKWVLDNFSEEATP